MRHLVRQLFNFRHVTNWHIWMKAVVFGTLSLVATDIIILFWNNGQLPAFTAHATDLGVRIVMYYFFETGWETIHRKV